MITQAKFMSIGNAVSEMAESAGLSRGAPQPNGQIVVEPMMDVNHVGEAVAYIAGLPHNVTVLTFNIMYDLFHYVVEPS